MLAERRMQEVLDKFTQNTQLDMDIINAKGYIVASSLKDRVGIREKFIENNVAPEAQSGLTYGGRTYMKFSHDIGSTYYLSMEGTHKVIRNYCYLGASFMELYLKKHKQPMNREDIIRTAIKEGIRDIDFREAVREYDIEAYMPRSVIVVRTEDMEATELYSFMLNAFPGNTDDYIVLVDSQTLALLKTLEENSDEDELIQLGEAIEDTILNETTIKSSIGIGGIKDGIYRIKQSYSEALIAIDIGRIYGLNTRVHSYDKLLLERFLYDIPIELGRQYYRQIFRRKHGSVLTDEMIVTIEKFFENSLNLSETSRQLYIHRNTLVYRLDKVHRALGLDLRNFHDAVTFKIMIMLEKQSRECSN